MAPVDVVGDQAGVLMVTGAYPPDVCGVGDYTARLMAAVPSEWQLFVERDWSFRAAPGLLRRLLRRRPDHIVIQYPTQGYGWSLVPHLLAAVGWATRRYRTIMALHEFSSLSRKAQFVLALASHVLDHIIFTTDVERDQARTHPLFSAKVPTSVIGILSNIPWCSAPPAFGARAIDIAYFGHIRPNKGLDDFLDVMAEIRQADPVLRIAIIGVVPRGYEGFGADMDARCRAIGCEMIRDLDDDAAGTMLADVRILYLPFRDGVSARRGSVLAGLGNGVLIASRIGPATPSTLLPAVIGCTGTLADVPKLLNALRMSDAQAAVMQHAGHAYIASMLPRDWTHVAELYAQVISRTGAMRARPA